MGIIATIFFAPPDAKDETKYSTTNPGELVIRFLKSFFLSRVSSTPLRL